MSFVNGRLTAAQLVTVGNDAHGRLAQFRPEAAASWNRMRALGMPHDVTDTYRDLARQERYWRNPPNAAGLAARPGTSVHGLGLAVDARRDCLTWLAAFGAEHGWVRTIMPAEPWHFEYRADLDQHRHTRKRVPTMVIIKHGSRYRAISGDRLAGIDPDDVPAFAAAGIPVIAVSGKTWDNFRAGFTPEG